MIEAVEHIESVLKEIDLCLSEPTEIYLIGGGAMMYNALKAFTKDYHQKEHFLATLMI